MPTETTDTSKISDAARRVLDDVAESIKELRETSDEGEFRRRWITTCVLLQTTKDIFFKICAADLASDDRKIFLKKWEDKLKTTGEPHVYIDFINSERNRICHEYKCGFSFVNQSTGGGGGFGFGGGFGGFGWGNGFSVRKIKKFVAEPFHNRDPIELAEEARQWWNEVLDEFDNLLSQNL